MDLQSSIEVISRIIEIVSKVQEIFSGIDVKLWVGILSLGGVLYTVRNTRKNVNRTNDLKKELEGQTNKLKKELTEQTNKITKELGEKNLKALEQRRYIDAISAERIKWINTIRDKFSEFIKLAYLQMADFSYWKQKFPGKIEEDAEKELINRFHDITYASVQILLLLNPKEIISDRIDNLQNDIKSKLRSTRNIEKFDFKELADLAEELMYLHQVVLKSEWKRVKEENKIGEEIDDNAMNNIYISVAKKLDKDLYNKYLNQLEEKVFN
ncbi:hypothetical protein ACN91_15100 [Bacillus cereus]|uniref:hypothetical protein n=1 Tax=Bacillus cereus TaxID=1396 RepID=UPI0006AD749B|nr:hypothetical protein [Bacillus cereus]ALC55205.1 hypothetical protein ACN91_15100 [Bacillus cereus]